MGNGREGREFVCNEVKSGYAKVECNESCSYHKDKQKKVLVVFNSHFFFSFLFIHS